MGKQPNTKLPVIFLSNYHNDPIANKPKCALTIGLPTSAMENPVNNGLFQKDTIYNCIYDTNEGIVLTDDICWGKQDIVSMEADRNIDMWNPFVLKDSDGIYRMWYTGNSSFHYRIHYATSPDGVNWTKHGVIVDLGADGDTDNDIWSLSVLKDSDGTYKMWYTGNNSFHYRIHYATSEDGVNWTKYGVVLDLGTNRDTNDYGVCDPFVFKDSNGIYRMWYVSFDSSYWKIYYATSDNGINWTKYGVILDLGADGNTDNDVFYPSVLKDSDGTYKMWYSGYDGTHWRIYYATSPDGINWTKHGVVVDLGADEDTDDNGIYHPSVFKDSNGTYKMWYDSSDGFHRRIHYATSPDGVNWTKHGIVVNMETNENINDNDVFMPKDSDTIFHNFTINTMESINESLHPLLRNPNVSIADHVLTEDWGTKGLTIPNGADKPYIFITREIQLESDDQNQLETLVNATIKDIMDKLKQVKQQNIMRYNHITLQCNMV